MLLAFGGIFFYDFYASHGMKLTIQSTNLGEYNLKLFRCASSANSFGFRVCFTFFPSIKQKQIQGLVKVDARDVRIAALSSPAWKAFLQQNLTRGEDFDESG